MTALETLTGAGPATSQPEITALFERIERLRPVLEATALEAEHLQTLPPAAVDALREIRIYDLKAPVEVGGLGVDPVNQIKAFAAIARANPSAGWCSFTGAATGNIVGGSLPDQGIEVVFGPERRPTFAGVLAVTGDAEPVDGGWRVSGKWSYLSGVRHAEWVSFSCRANSGAGHLIVVVPRDVVTIQDDWTTTGLMGTGSNTVVVDDVFVPEYMAWDPTQRPLRGGPITNLGTGGNLAPDPVGFALGVAQRAIDEVVVTAGTRRRGGRGVALADRGAFQLELARSIMSINAAEALAFKQLGEAWETACSLGYLPSNRQSELRALMTYTVESCAEAVRRLWPHLGASELQAERPFQRCLRDLSAAMQHYHVSYANYEAFAASTIAAAAVRGRLPE